MNEEITNVDQAQVSRNLHYVLDNGVSTRCRPAMVVENWPGSSPPGLVNLVVFPDGSNDGRGFLSASQFILPIWKTSVPPNHAIKANRTWHWPRECDHMQEPAPPYVDRSGKTNHHNHISDVEDSNCYACSQKRTDQGS